MALDASIRRIRTLADCHTGDAFSEIVVTGTGFFHKDRILLRELCSLAHIKYCGELACGWTTHLVVNNQMACATDRTGTSTSQKISRARDWDIPIVSLQWLVDSIFSGAPLPVQGYTSRCCGETKSRSHLPVVHHVMIEEKGDHPVEIPQNEIIDRMQHMNLESEASGHATPRSVALSSRCDGGSLLTPGTVDEVIPPTPDTDATVYPASASFHGALIQTLGVSEERSPCNGTFTTSDVGSSKRSAPTLSFPSLDSLESNFHTILSRPPRGNTVKTKYKLSNYKNVCFVEELFVHKLGCSMRMMDTHRAVKLSIGDKTQLAEVLTIYTFADHDASIKRFRARQDQEWYVEYHRFYTYQEAKDMDIDVDRNFVGVSEKERCREVVRSKRREHAPVSCITGFELVHRTVPPKHSAIVPLALGVTSIMGGEGYWWQNEV
jgi:hypothetical protein